MGNSPTFTSVSLFRNYNSSTGTIGSYSATGFGNYSIGFAGSFVNPGETVSLGGQNYTFLGYYIDNGTVNPAFSLNNFNQYIISNSTLTGTYKIVEAYYDPTLPAPTYSIAVSASGGASGATASGPEGTAVGSGTTFTYTVTRTGSTADAGSIVLSLGGTAGLPGTAGADYTVASGTGADAGTFTSTGSGLGRLTFQAGHASATFTVTTTPDGTIEPNETVKVTLHDGNDTAATATILDDDTPIVITTPTVTYEPPDPGYTFTTNAAGGRDITLTNPGVLNSGLGTPQIDTVIYGVNQPLRLPDNIENIVLSGPGSGFTITGNGLDNTFTVGNGSWSIDGVSGNDTVRYATSRAAHTVQVNNDGSFTIGGPEGVQQISHVGTIRFSDDVITFDTSAAGAQVARLYDAVLHRQADPGGAANALNQLNGGVSLTRLAQAFLNSIEGMTQYAPTQTNQQFVDALYANVLHRTADTTGAANWLAALNGGATRGAILAAFSESQEHVNYVASHTAIVGVAADHPLTA